MAIFSSTKNRTSFSDGDPIAFVILKGASFGEFGTICATQGRDSVFENIAAIAPGIPERTATAATKGRLELELFTSSSRRR